MARSVVPYLDKAWSRLYKGRGQSEIPDVINLADVNSSWPEFRAGVRASLKSGQVGPDYVEIIDAPKNPFAVRPIARLTVHDRLVYDTLVFAIASLIESELRESVFSARWGDDGEEFWSPVNSWVSMQKRGVEIISDDPFQLARTDIVSFYEHIDVSTLAIDIQAVGASEAITERLVRYLRMFQQSSHAWGIPQGPDASGILANIYLLPVDEFVHRAGFAYLRYSDDMMIFDTDRESLRNALLEINSILRSRRLSMSGAKTKIYDHRESVTQLEDLEKDAINYGIRIGESNAGERLYKLFTEAVEGPQRDRDVKFALFRMGRLKDDRALPWVLRNLKENHHLASQLLQYLECFPERRPATGRAFISTMQLIIDHKYDHLEQRILQAATRQGVHSPTIRDMAWAILQDKNKSNLPREFAARYLGRNSTVADGQLLRRQYEDEQNVNVRRALLVAMYEAKSVSRGLLRSLASSESQLSWVSQYLLKEPYIPLPR
ncbi:reverse transcriptase domain-containing protein [Streptomyces griseoluteus]|uniref:RNA-directed DNA polymerase n=1 Tax=Streptomyces griseoluteus TaxID=29306 RepID=UPI0036FE6E7C